ncbi:hypothetical protein [Azospirillum melinis]
MRFPLTPTLSPGRRGGQGRMGRGMRHIEPNNQEQTKNILALA